ncbi:MAG TPA: ABC transporter substrate-binding protein [Acetobacteraceae bacterium]|jgi:peptide/nickel transport system substrate-binding protein
MRRFQALSAALAAGILLGGATASAADLTIGRATEQNSLDPQFSDLGNDVATAENMFESMIEFDSKLRIHPSLAVSWKLLDPLTWEIRLRPGVTFHDGTPFTGADVAFSLQRARDVPNSPGPLASFVRPVQQTEVVDPLTLHIHTDQPTPLLMDMVGRIFIVPAKLGASVTTEDFSAGRAMIGTGPYRFRQALPGDRVVVAANRDYWGEKPAFDTVTLKFLANAAARSAALLSGAVDVIEQISPSDISVFQNRQDVALFSVTSTRMIYLAMDQGRDDSPFITDKDGAPLKVNPLKDRRVRLALSKLINRAAIVERVVAGAGEAAGQIVPEGMGGYDPSLQPMAFDPEGAKQLLTDAGYPNGFGLTLHGSNNRFPNDSQLTQALGQMFSRGGLKVNGVEVLPYNVYAPGATARKYSLFIFSYGSVASSSLNGLSGVLATYDKEAGTGSLNRARYSNPAFDALLKLAATEFDEAKRNQLLADATRVAMEDAGILPIYWQKLYWAARKGLVVDPDRGESTSARFVSLSK